MSEQNETKWYKAFRPDLTCNGFRYEVGGTYEMEEPPVVCERGFHYCTSLTDVYWYYPPDFTTRICLVTPLGEIAREFVYVPSPGDPVLVESPTGKCCTDRIRIDRELAPKEIVEVLFEEYADIVRRFPGAGWIHRRKMDEIRDSAANEAFLPDVLPDRADRRRRAVEFIEAFKRHEDRTTEDDNGK